MFGPGELVHELRMRGTIKSKGRVKKKYTTTRRHYEVLRTGPLKTENKKMGTNGRWHLTGAPWRQQGRKWLRLGQGPGLSDQWKVFMSGILK